MTKKYLVGLGLAATLGVSSLAIITSCGAVGTGLSQEALSEVIKLSDFTAVNMNTTLPSAATLAQINSAITAATPAWSLLPGFKAQVVDTRIPVVEDEKPIPNILDRNDGLGTVKVTVTLFYNDKDILVSKDIIISGFQVAPPTPANVGGL